MLADFLREPLLDKIDVDSTDRMTAHEAILNKKPMIREVFTEIHGLMWKLSRQLLDGNGQDIEIGAGVYPIKRSYSSVLATDVVPSTSIDRVMDAQAMDVADGSVRTIFGQHCFHHLPQPEKFFSELDRVLVPGGGAVLVEPYWSPVASVLYKRLFASEGFDKNSPNWDNQASGAMSDANQALSYVVFERDRSRYDRLFPSLPIVYQAPLGNYMRYLLSGGLNFRQLLPDAFTSVIKGVEGGLSPFNRWVALHHVIVIRKSRD